MIHSAWRRFIGRKMLSSVVLAGFVAVSASFAPVAQALEPSSTVSAASQTVVFGAHNSKQVLGGSQWQSKKKKKRKVQITDPDTLPQPLVQIIPGSTINLLSRSSKVPIAIKNDYDNQVRVRVRVQANNLKVLFPVVVEVDVPAHTTVTAKVPVNAIADGDVELKATLETFSGLRLTIPVSLKMNVILGVEDTVLYGFLSFVTLLGALGWFRTVRKRRRENLAGAER